MISFSFSLSLSVMSSLSSTKGAGGPQLPNRRDVLRDVGHSLHPAEYGRRTGEHKAPNQNMSSAKVVFVANERKVKRKG